jgi:hypothetical protein
MGNLFSPPDEWADDPQLFDVKLQYLWGNFVLQIPNLVALAVIGWQNNLFNEQTFIYEGNNQRGTVQIAIYPLVAVAITMMYAFGMEMTVCCGAKQIYFEAIKNGRNGSRWMFETIPANTIELFAVMMLTGVRNYVLWIPLIFIFVMSLAGLGRLERIVSNKKTLTLGVRTWHMILSVSSCVPYIFIFWAMGLNTFTYSIVVATMSLFFHLMLLWITYARMVSNQLKTVEYERYLQLLSFTTRYVISWVIYGYLLNN